MSDIKNNLQPNEKIILSANKHPIILARPLIYLLLTITFVIYTFSITRNPELASVLLTLLCPFSIALTIVTALVGIKTLVVLLTTELAVTNRRIITKTSFLHTRIQEIYLPKIESTYTHQNILGKLLNFGDIIIIGTGGTREHLPGITDPLQIKKKVDQIINYYTHNSTSNAQ